MSTIEELRIQGIRSFGGKSEDMQLVEFSSPVTLILGENGCGKTTIIECLKYALTGEAPPGSSRGQHFVHDPTIFGFSESLGQIKLRVKNIRGEEQTVSRCMKLHYKRGKLTFETMDSTISYGDESISKRCIDVDVAMCQFMGVSKAIINNVIFCHQEDSSWPLDEPKKLKEKFDAIFGITEYNKAIEKFMAMRKDQVNELKKKEITLKHLSYLKKEMENKTMDLQGAYEKYSSIEEQCAKFEEEMKPINKRLDEIRKVEYEVGKQQSLKVAVETKKKTSSERISKLKAIIKKPFEGSIQQLDREIRSFKEKISEKRIKKQELDETLVSLQKQEKKVQSTLSDLEKKGCVLLQQRQREQESNAERAEKMHELCDKLGINVHANLEESTEAVPAILQNIAKSLEVEEKKIKDQKATHEKADQEKQKIIDGLRETKARFENDIESKEKQRKQCEVDLRKAEKEINEVEASANLLKEVTERINAITERYEKYSKAMNQEGLKAQIAEKKASVTRLEEKFKTLDAQLTFLNSISKLMAGIHLKEEELERKEQEMRRIKSKHNANLKKILDRPVESNFKVTVQTVSNKLQRQVKELNEKINNLKLKEQSCEIKRKTKKDELSRWEKDLGEKNDKIYEKCRSTPYKELLAKSSELISRYQLENGALKSSEAMYKRYIKNIEEDPSCPLCHNSMCESDASSLTAELTEKIQRLPENISRSEKLLKAEQKKYDSLIELRRVIEEVENLERDIPIRKNELKELETNIAEITSEIESCQMLQIEPSANVELANSMLGDMSILDEAMKEVKRINADLKELKKKLPENSSTASIDDVQLEKTTVAAELENERKILDKKQVDYETASEQLNQLREERNKLKDTQIKLQEGLQSIPQLKERKADLSKQIDTIAKEIIKLRQDLQPLKDKLDDSLADKLSTKENNSKIINEMQDKLESLKSLNQDIQRLHRELIELDRLNLAEEIKRIKSSGQRYKEELLQKTNEISKAAKELEKLKDEILNQDLEERDLKDNRDLKELEEEAKKLDVEIEELSKLLCDLDFRRVSKEKDELIKKNDQFVMKRSALIGQMGEINNQISKLKAEIDAPEYKNSIQNYRKSLYEVEVVKRTIADLGQYRLALEYALIKFHSEKMEKINRLIREYWRQIYRGNDIDYIQIQTDEMKTDASADKRRSYNYRVIQSKNNSEIEMRGRCSAGQRVLASLIIRMALAETFSCNCGVLALDEPTTNLDRTNIRSLCEALNRIVDERQTQHNFMLIIITHDEEFISTLGRIDLYHHVLRNDEGKSMIRKVKVR